MRIYLGNLSRNGDVFRNLPGVLSDSSIGSKDYRVDGRLMV